jgi:hypothetical protein
MMARRGVLGLLGGASAFLLSGCGLIWPSDRLRQRITVEVETPQGLRTGSSVVETEVREGKSWGDASGTKFVLKGEAVALDLGGGQTLFALLSGADGGDATGYQTRLLSETLRAIGASGPAGDVSKLNLMETRAAAKRARAVMALPENLYPMLVRFKDINDPKSVALVDPLALDNSFGTGVKLRRVTVTVTDDPVTSGIEKRLGWLGEHRNNSFAGNRYSIDASLADKLYMGSFSTEIAR